MSGAAAGSLTFAPEEVSRGRAVFVAGVATPGSERPRLQGVLSIRRRCSDGSNFGEPLDRILVVPADGDFPGRRRLRGDFARVLMSAGEPTQTHENCNARFRGGAKCRP